jgi:hypothetical protein
MKVARLYWLNNLLVSQKSAWASGADSVESSETGELSPFVGFPAAFQVQPFSSIAAWLWNFLRNLSPCNASMHVSRKRSKLGANLSVSTARIPSLVNWLGLHEQNGHPENGSGLWLQINIAALNQLFSSYLLRLPSSGSDRLSQI